MPVIGLRALQVVHHQVSAVRFDRLLEALHRREQIRQIVGSLGSRESDSTAPQPLADLSGDVGTLTIFRLPHWDNTLSLFSKKRAPPVILSAAGAKDLLFRLGAHRKQILRYARVPRASLRMTTALS